MSDRRPRSRDALKTARAYRKAKAFKKIGPGLVGISRLPEWDETNRKAIDRALVTLGLDYVAYLERLEKEDPLTGKAADPVPQLTVSTEWDSVDE